jgi:hypothetical protein
MGLRPTVKSEEGNHRPFNKSAENLIESQDNETNPNAPSPPYGGNGGSSSSSSGSGRRTSSNGNSNSNSSFSSSTTPPSTPQREAWTARGQMLLNFHDAISRAINSPEMSRKCNRIAQDNNNMSRRSEENATLSRPAAPTNNANSIIGSGRQKPTTTHSIAEEYGAEAALIVENKAKRDAAVRNKAVALGIFSFVTLRSGRGLSSWIRKSIANRRASSSYKFDNMPMMSAKPSSSSSLAAAEKKAKAIEIKQPSKLRRFFRLSFDLTISTSITLLSGTFLFMPRPSAYIEDMSKLPLVEGKSVYAEMVCPPLLKEYRRVLEQYGGRWPVRGAQQKGEGSSNAEGLTQEDVSLNVIRTFVENCSKRSKYEHALLEERNALSDSLDDRSSAVSRMMRKITNNQTETTTASEKNNPDLNEGAAHNDKLGTISVPSPGVPDDIPVDLDRDVFSLVDREDDEENER